MSPLQLFAALMIAHAVCDYPWQGEFLAKAKSRVSPIPGFPWWQALGAHALIHGGAVWLVTAVAIVLSSLAQGHDLASAFHAATLCFWLGALEFAAHAVTDDAKCNGRLSLNQDQAIHAACKALWVLVVVWSQHVR